MDDVQYFCGDINCPMQRTVRLDGPCPKCQPPTFTSDRAAALAACCAEAYRQGYEDAQAGRPRLTDS